MNGYSIQCSAKPSRADYLWLYHTYPAFDLDEKVNRDSEYEHEHALNLAGKLDQKGLCLGCKSGGGGGVMNVVSVSTPWLLDPLDIDPDGTELL
jgi:hypothetical protein